MKKSGAALLFLLFPPLLSAAGCGGRVDDSGGLNTGSAAPSGATAPTPKKPQKIDLPDPDPEEPSACPNGETISDAAIEQEIGSPYKGPAARAAACSDLDIANFNVNVNATNSAFTDLEKGLSDECKACIFTKTSAEAWGPVVLLDARPTDGFVNFGACYASATGEMGCGRAVQYAEFCKSNACSACGTTADLSACYTKVEGTTCKAAHDTAIAKCDASASAKCGASIFEHVQYLCAMK